MDKNLIPPSPVLPTPLELQQTAYQRARDRREANIEKWKSMNKEEKAESIRVVRRANVKKAQATVKAKQQRKIEIQRKIARNEPITEEERELLCWRQNLKGDIKKAKDELLLAQASKLLIRPTHVNELRAMVERTANKYAYNPIEELIILTQKFKDRVTGEEKYVANQEDRIAIHKTLLPFLVPVLRSPPPKDDDPKDKGTKVTIQRFVLENDAPTDTKIFHSKPITVDTGPSPDTPQT